MENASKALLMAGGVLIAILVISLLVFAFNQISDYRKSASNLEKDTQLAKFNEQFTQYINKNLKGTDLISLVNRVIDFNQTKNTAGEIDYNQKIEVKINLAPAGSMSFKDKYSGGNLFKDDNYTIPTSASNNCKFAKALNEMRNLERTYSLKVLDTISSNYESLKSYYIDNDKRHGKSLDDVIGSKTLSQANYDELVNMLKNANKNTIIEQYREYSELKTSTFKATDEQYAPNGQIKLIGFEFVK